MNFVNTLPYISNPIEEFAEFKFVDWESGIYPKFKGAPDKAEIYFFTDLIVKNNWKDILDLGVGNGSDLSAIAKELRARNYKISHIEANEVDEDFIQMARENFAHSEQEILIHRANWLDLPAARPAYEQEFDFVYLIGNSLTYIGGGTREYTKKAQQSVVSKFAKLIKPGGYIFLDSRNYDYIRSLMHLPRQEMLQNFTFDYSVYYHGFDEKVLVFPAYVSDTVVVLHYYDREERVWSKLDVYPIYHNDLIEIMSQDFAIKQVYYDFGRGSREKSLFVQVLARKK